MVYQMGRWAVIGALGIIALIGVVLHLGYQYSYISPDLFPTVAKITSTEIDSCADLASKHDRPTMEVWRCMLRRITGTEQTDISCQDLYRDYTQDTFFPKDYMNHLEILDTIMHQYDTGEGHSGSFWQSGMLYYDLARNPLVKKIFQIGFNAGHSTLSLLSGNSHSKVLSFDIGRWPYTNRSAVYLDSIFPGRHTLILGSSNDTVPKYLKENPHITGTCDYVIVDGGHTFQMALADLIHMKNYSHPGTVLLLDDMGYYNMGYNDGPKQAWAKLQASKFVSPLFHCGNSKWPKKHRGRGSMVGRYVWS